MRKGLPTFLVLLSFFAPLMAAIPTSDDARLPACCRRNGAHHCAGATAMAAQLIAGHGASFSAPLTCPSYPSASAALLIPTYAIAPAPAQLPVSTRYTGTRAEQSATLRTLFHAAHSGRAPPQSAQLFEA